MKTTKLNLEMALLVLYPIVVVVVVVMSLL
jgi:hypothetical protein